MLSNDRIKKLKTELQNEKKQLLENTSGVQNDFHTESQTDSVGELSAIDNHPGDLGTELYEREKDAALDEHQTEQLKKVDQALAAIHNKKYGVCQECGREIPFERLQAVPTALYCVDHTPDSTINGNRPVEEEVLQPPMDREYRHHSKEVKDYQDSFKEVASYGTSETPADFTGDYDNINEMYNDIEDETEGFTENYETFTATDITGKNQGFYRSDKEKKYKEELDEQGTESQLGDIPYKKKDSYIDK